MRLLVTGGRDYANRGKVRGTLARIHADTPITILIEGGAQGADRLAWAWATCNGIHVATVQALWSHYGSKAAGPLRNDAMLTLRPDRVLAFPGGSGTAGCVRSARALGIPVSVVDE